MATITKDQRLNVFNIENYQVDSNLLSLQKFILNKIFQHVCNGSDYSQIFNLKLVCKNLIKSSANLK